MQQSILFHICCADCGLKLLDAAERDLGISRQQITCYFYNPNIHPETEHLARQKAVQKMLGTDGATLVIANWTPADYFSAIRRAREDRPDFDEFSKKDRCPVCWELRLSKTFAYAREHGFGTVSSTLLSSIYHDRKTISAISKRLAASFGLDMYVPKTVDHCLKTSGFYKQNYEGCVFSLMEKMRGKYLAEGRVNSRQSK